MSKALCDLDAVTLRRSIGTSDISPVDLLESCIARIEAVNPVVNAVVATCYTRARAEAKAATDAVKRGNTLGVLHGLPLLVKDLSETEGLTTTYGSLCFEGNVPSNDSALVARLRAAGAIVLGKTNTPEFGVGANTSNKVYGATRNPFNLAMTSGGSSGGSAVALACAMAPLATGSDLGGSLRIPASFCSVVGMRPSPGIVPSFSHVLGFSPLWTDGPMARNVADTALCLSAMAGFEAADPLSFPKTPSFGNCLDQPIDLTGLRVGFSTDLGLATVDHEISKIFESRKVEIGCHFHEASDLDLDLAQAADVFRVLRAESVYASLADLVAEKGSLIGVNVRSNILEAETFTLADTARAGAAHTRLFRQFQTLFESVDVLICPATAVSPFPVKDSYPEQINGIPLDGYYAWYAITWALSLMGCPIITIPCGLDHKGMPFGVQIIGPRHRDNFVLQAAQALEQRLTLSDTGRHKPVDLLRKSALL